MNQCESIRNLFSELLDGELGNDHVHIVDIHLGQCAVCRDELRALRQLDQRLAEALTIDGIDEKMQQVVFASNAAQATVTTRMKSKRRFRWLGISAAIAASLLLGFFVWSPSKPPPVLVNSVAARLVSATGPVEIRIVGEKRWRTVLPPETMEIRNGARVRTAGAALCEIQLTDQGKIRMDRGCEIIVNDSQKLQLVTGKLWCSAPSDRELEVNVPIQQSEQPIIAMLTCPSKTILQCEATPSSVSCSSPPGAASNEAAEMHVGEETWQVGPGETIVIASSQHMRREPRAETADVWQLPLLALSSDSRQELSSYLQKLLAPIGRTKTLHMNENQIRALGPAGAIPLLSFVIHEQGADLDLRRTAMRLAAETANESTIPMLRQLTEDEDSFIASTATKLLDGLTEKTKPKTQTEDTGLAKEE